MQARKDLKPTFQCTTKSIDRQRSPPYIKEGFPKNKTALLNTTVELECPSMSDTEPYTYWLRTLVVNNSIPTDIDKLEVCLFV